MPSDDLTQWIDNLIRLDARITLDVNLGIGFLAYWICYMKWDFRRKELSKNALSNSRKLMSFRPITDKQIKNWIQRWAKVRGRTFISMGSISKQHNRWSHFSFFRFVVFVLDFPCVDKLVSIFRCLIGKRNTWVSICYTVLLCSTLLILYSSNLLHKKPFEPSESYKVDSQFWKVLHKVLHKLKNNISPLKIKVDSCRFLKIIS